MSEFSAAVRRTARRVEIALCGDLDAAGVLRLEPLLDDIPAEPEAPVVFDLRDVTFIDSTGLSLLLSVYERLSAQGATVRFISGPRDVMRVFAITGLGDTLPFVS